MSRPAWTESIRMFVMDEVIDEKYDYPMDGSGDELLDKIERAVCGVLCERFGHEIIDDQCLIAAHRFCIYCNRRESDL